MNVIRMSDENRIPGVDFELHEDGSGELKVIDRHGFALVQLNPHDASAVLRALTIAHQEGAKSAPSAEETHAQRESGQSNDTAGGVVGDIVDRLLSFGPSIENAIHAIFLWDQDYCVTDEDHAESDADTEAMRNLGELVLEAAAEIQRLRAQLEEGRSG